MPCVALLPLLHSSLELIYSHGTCMYISVVHSLHVFAIREKMAECSFEHGQSFIFCLFVCFALQHHNKPKQFAKGSHTCACAMSIEYTARSGQASNSGSQVCMGTRSMGHECFCLDVQHNVTSHTQLL